jgi:hypothetical protein
MGQRRGFPRSGRPANADDASRARIEKSANVLFKGKSSAACLPAYARKDCRPSRDWLTNCGTCAGQVHG